MDVRGLIWSDMLVPGCGQPQTKPPIGKGLNGVIAFISCELVWMVYGIMVLGLPRYLNRLWNGFTAKSACGLSTKIFQSS